MESKQQLPKLTIVVPCFNEEAVIGPSSQILLAELHSWQKNNLIAANSQILFIDDGSTDATWAMIKHLASLHQEINGLRLSRNEGHQRALLAGLLEAEDDCDITISLDVDLQDDIHCIPQMIAAYQDGCQIVYGVRKSREHDSFAKKWSALLYYRIQHFFDTNSVPNHADFRLLSKAALKALSRFTEQDLYLRGLIPMLGFPSTKVYYERLPRLAGESKYSIKAMWKLAKNGLLGITTKLLNWIFPTGLAMTILTPLCWLIFTYCYSEVGLTAHLFFLLTWLSGLNLTALGCLAIYLRRIYLQQKQRPRYHIMERTENVSEPQSAEKGA